MASQKELIRRIERIQIKGCCGCNENGMVQMQNKVLKIMRDGAK